MMRLDTTSPYLAIRGLQDLWGLDPEVNPTWTYTNLPYAVYMYSFGDELVEGAYLVALTIPESEAVMMILVLTQDFERDEVVLVAIMNSIRLVERE